MKTVIELPKIDAFLRYALETDPRNDPVPLVSLYALAKNDPRTYTPARKIEYIQLINRYIYITYIYLYKVYRYKYLYRYLISIYLIYIYIYISYSYIDIDIGI